MTLMNKTTEKNATFLVQVFTRHFNVFNKDYIFSMVIFLFVFQASS